MVNLDYEIILYVENQEISTRFYQSILCQEPSLCVFGMTSFTLSDNVKLGLMPNSGISKIITPKMPNPKLGFGIPRCELYIKTELAEERFNKALQLGAKLVDSFSNRDWGDCVGYLSDPDGHIIAFAKKQINQ
ncbi:MAG: lactoylglutathione lyase [Bacteroidota bacterium]